MLLLLLEGLSLSDIFAILRFSCFFYRAAAFGNKECVRLLLTSGAAVDPRDANSLTPFLCAVAAEKKDCAKMLLNNGADIAVRDKVQRCCVHLAVERKNDDLLTILLEKSGSKLINFPDIHERTPLHYAAISSNTRVRQRNIVELFVSFYQKSM